MIFDQKILVVGGCNQRNEWKEDGYLLDTEQSSLTQLTTATDLKYCMRSRVIQYERDRFVTLGSIYSHVHFVDM